MQNPAHLSMLEGSRLGVGKPWPSRCYWTSISSRMHVQWPGLMGVVVQLHLDSQWFPTSAHGKWKRLCLVLTCLQSWWQASFSGETILNTSGHDWENPLSRHYYWNCSITINLKKTTVRVIRAMKAKREKEFRTPYARSFQPIFQQCRRKAERRKENEAREKGGMEFPFLTKYS